MCSTYLVSECRQRLDPKLRYTPKNDIEFDMSVSAYNAEGNSVMHHQHLQIVRLVCRDRKVLCLLEQARWCGRIPAHSYPLARTAK